MSSISRYSRPVLGALALIVAGAAQAAPVYNAGSGNGGVSFGVTGFVNIVPAAPTYINNNFSNRQDIMSSPGVIFQTAAPTIPNNIREVGPAGLNVFGFQVGGGNANGPFGSGSVLINPTTIGYSLKDFATNDGSGSYAVASWRASFTEQGGYQGSFGNWLAMGGLLPAVGSDAAVSLRTFIDSANPASPFFGGIDLPELVLAIDRVTLGGTYAFSTRGGFGPAGQGTAVIQVTNPLLGSFKGVAFNNIPNINIPNGDVFTVWNTLTVIADPSELDSDVDVTDLLAGLPNESLPGYAVAGVSAVPEPEFYALLLAGLGLLSMATRRRMR